MLGLLLGCVLVLLAACSGGDDASPEERGDDGAPEDVVIGGEDFEAPALVLSDVAVDGDALFPCDGAPGPGTVRVIYIQQRPVEVAGPLGEAFRAAVGDHQRRCGGPAAGAVEVAVGYADSAPGGDVCALEALDGAAIVVTDSTDDAAAECLASSDRLVWVEAGASDPSTMAGTEAPPAIRAATAVAAALAEGVIGDRRVVVLHDGSSRLAGAVETGVAPQLDEASVDIDNTAEACTDGDAPPDLSGAFVIALLPADCLSRVTTTAAATGADVRWLVIEDDLSLAPVDDALFDAQVFDTALAYEFAPTMLAGLPRDRAPVARDRACVAFLDEFTGNQTEFPSLQFSAHARLCSTVAGVLAVLDAAGRRPDARRAPRCRVHQQLAPGPVAGLASRGSAGPLAGASGLHHRRVECGLPVLDLCPWPGPGPTHRPASHPRGRGRVTPRPPVPDRGVNRVIVAVWDFEEGKQFFENLLGATFAPENDDGQAASFGVRVAMAWDAGIELVAPLPGVPSAIRDDLDANGEGVKGVVFAVPDADEARDRAADLGLATYYSLDFDQATIDAKCEGRFTTFKEHFVSATAPLDGTILLGEFVRRR